MDYSKYLQYAKKDYSISLPDIVIKCISTLEKAGYECFVVGGSIRDSIMNSTVVDWDFCTNASPEDVKKCFSFCKVIETGIRFGTLTVIIDNANLEITTYRKDDDYTNHRTPSHVAFSRNLTDDLPRRDFTMNSLAYNPATGLIDVFGGSKDIENKIIKCVGSANDRIIEDALRIMRGLRFSSKLGFCIDSETNNAINNNYQLLRHISAERISKELCGLLLGKNAVDVIFEYYNIFEYILSTFNRQSVKLTSINYLNAFKYCDCPSVALGLTAIIKCCQINNYKAMLKNLKIDNKTIYAVNQLMENIEKPLNSKIDIKKSLLNVGYEITKQSLYYQCACNKVIGIEKNNIMMLNNIMQNDKPITLKQLQIKGNDIEKLGLKNKKNISIILNTLLIMIIEEKLLNDKNKLISVAKKLISELEGTNM